MTIHYTTNQGVAYADADTALVDLALITQQIAANLDDKMSRAGYTPPDATTFAAEVAARGAGDSALAARLARLEGPWTAVSTTTSYSQLATAGGAVVTGLQQTIGLIPAGHQAEVELAIPSVSVPASTTVQIILQDATGTPVVLDAAELSTGATGGAVGVPVRLAGTVVAGASDLTNRVIRTWLIQTVGASSANLKAAGGAPARMRYRIR